MKVLSEERTREIWRSADAVCFDVDSTVVTGEGIDELASFCGRGREVSEWTIKAMGGGVPFRTALEERLKIIKPTQQQIEEFLKRNPLHLTENIREIMAELISRNTTVYLISGGFRCIIESHAKELKIPSENVFANVLKFDENGNYSGFDLNQPTSSSGGKAKVVQLLKQKHSYKRLVMVGDGATDMEACPPADAFIGFGGNVVREKVKQNAGWFVTDFGTLINELQFSK